MKPLYVRQLGGRHLALVVGFECSTYIGRMNSSTPSSLVFEENLVSFLYFFFACNSNNE